MNKDKTRFWTILGYFLLTHDIERKIYEDNENQVHFDVRSIATMLYSNLETGSKDKINLLGKRIRFSELRKMSSVSIIISVNYDIKLPENLTLRLHWDVILYGVGLEYWTHLVLQQNSKQT